MLDYALLQRLCTTNGIAGHEDAVRTLILSEIRPHADRITVDPLGNILAFKKGREVPQQKLLLSAHMDEVGFIVTHITQDGCLQFAPVGGINAAAAFARHVRIGEDAIPGVVCHKPLHLLKADERKKSPAIEDLLIDIGAESRADAEQYISLGDPIYFESLYENAHGRVISKALDDRFGCLVLIELLRQPLAYDMYFSFVVQEEIGLRGARVAAYTIDPDSAIVVEATTAADVPYAEEEKQVCRVGEGAVVSFMDRSTLYDREYYRLAMDCAREQGVKAQTKTVIAGGNDAGAIHQSRGGVRTLAVSLPCRYIHSCDSLASTEDMESVYTVVKATAERILRR